MYALLTRTYNDIVGHEYSTPNVREPLKNNEVNDEKFNNLKEGITRINEVLQTCRRDILIPDNANIQYSHNETLEHFPLSSKIKSIETIVGDMKRMFNFEDSK